MTHQAHVLKTAGSNPAPASKQKGDYRNIFGGHKTGSGIDTRDRIIKTWNIVLDRMADLIKKKFSNMSLELKLLSYRLKISLIRCQLLIEDLPSRARRDCRDSHHVEAHPLSLQATSFTFFDYMEVPEENKDAKS